MLKSKSLIVMLLMVGLLVSATQPSWSSPIKVGAEVLVEEQLALLEGKKVGVITNHTSVLPTMEHLVDVLVEKGVDVRAAFGPEHGFRGDAQAGQAVGDFSVDPKTQVSVYSLYRRTPKQMGELFSELELDIVLFDIQDVGARFYTYIWSMLDSMEGAALANVPFVVLDRPNPLSGTDAFGPVLQERFSSFVGRLPLPLMHGMTVGELANLFNEEFIPYRTGARAELQVISMQGWHREMYYEDTGLPWVMPSPNMPTTETAIVYPGTCLIEGTNLSEGRGTTRPFELIGAPYIDGRLAAALNGMDLSGVTFREAYFTPTFSKYANTPVGGVQLYVTERQSFDPLKTAITIISTVMELYPTDFKWREDHFIDNLYGSEYLRLALDMGMAVDGIVEAWQDELAEFRQLRQEFLLYP